MKSTQEEGEEREKRYVPPTFTQLLTQTPDLPVFINKQKTFFKPNISTFCLINI